MVRSLKGLFLRPLPIGWWLSAALALGLLRGCAVIIFGSEDYLVPDESLYVTVLEGLKEGADVYSLGTALGYGPVIVTGSWMLLIPSIGVIDLGLSSLDALRLTSIMYSTGSSLILICILAIARRSPGSTAEAQRAGSGTYHYALASSAGLATLLLLFVPSYTLWSSLALRDSSSIFAAMLSALGLTLAISSRHFVLRMSGALLVAIGVAGLQLSRAYLSALILIALLCVTIWKPKGRRVRISVALALFAVLGFLGGEAIRGMYADAPERPVVPSTSTERPQGALPEMIGARIDSRVGLFSLNREKFMENAESAYAYNYCTTQAEVFEIAACEVVHLPVGLWRFLTLPHAVPWDVPHSRALLGAGVENYLWILILTFSLVSLVGRFSLNARLTSFLIIYGSLAITGYALVSGNAGTAFRHKSQFLWVFALIIGFGFGWRSWTLRLASRLNLRSRPQTNSD